MKLNGTCKCLQCAVLYAELEEERGLRPEAQAPLQSTGIFSSSLLLSSLEMSDTKSLEMSDTKSL